MFKLTSYLKRYKGKAILGPVFKFFEAIFDIITPILVALILDIGVPNGDKEYIIVISVVVILMNALGFVCAIVCSKCASKVSRGVGLDIRRDMYKKVNELSSAEKDKFTTMALTNRIVHDVNQLEIAISATIRQVARAPFLLIGSIIATLIIDIQLCAIFLVLTPVILLVVILIMKKTSPMYMQAKTELDKVSNVTRENLSGNRVVRAFNKQENEKAKFDKVNGQFTTTNINIGKLSAIMQPLLYLIINAGSIAVVFFGGVRVNIGGLTQGKIITFINYFMQISMALVIIARMIMIYIKTGASIKRINEVFTMSPGIKNASKPLPLSKDIPANIEFLNVNFSYNNQKNMVNDLSMYVPAGSTLGVIGGTGSGKSTLVNLLPRFYDVSSGEILINGVNIKKYDVEDLRKYISIVPQNPTLFKGTIESNLKFRNKNIGAEDMVKALMISQSYEFVCEKPDGIKSKVERGGTNFSGGQRQRLTIARALVDNPKIIILDDSSSALDFETDYKLRKALATMLKDTTKIIVSQRTNSIKDADNIIVLDNGNVVGMGKHEELLETCEIYKEIHKTQNKEENDG